MRDGRTWMALIMAAMSGLLGACAGGSGASIRHEGRPAGVVTMPLSGVYRATIVPPFDFIGPISGRISAEPKAGKGGGTTFVASTRPGIAWDMIGGVQGFLGSLFVPFIFPGGTIGTWNSSIPTGDAPGEGWFGVGGIKNAGVRTRIKAPDRPVELLVRDGRRVGLLLLEPDTPDSRPRTDYPALARSIGAAVRDHSYDAAATGSGPLRSYVKQVEHNAGVARDDVEFIFGLVAAARNHVKFTMPVAFPKGDPASRTPMEGWELAEVKPIRATFDEKNRIAWLRVDAFLYASDVDAAFDTILAWKPAAIMIDLRSCPGVTLASLRTLSWVMHEPVDAGVWFGSSRRDEMVKGVGGAPRVELASASGTEEVESVLEKQGAAHITVRPDPRAFSGPVAVLTSKRTSASAEPLVLALKSSGRAKVFGQPTVGKPFLSQPFDIGQGWVFWLAACDFRTAGGEGIPDTGIRPDFESSNRDVAVRAAERHLLAGTEPSPDPARDKAGNAVSPFEHPAPAH